MHKNWHRHKTPKSKNEFVGGSILHHSFSHFAPQNLHFRPRGPENLLVINFFQDHQQNSRRFPVFPGGISNSKRFPVFPVLPGVVDTLLEHWCKHTHWQHTSAAGSTAAFFTSICHWHATTWAHTLPAFKSFLSPHYSSNPKSSESNLKLNLVSFMKMNM